MMIMFHDKTGERVTANGFGKQMFKSATISEGTVQEGDTVAARREDSKIYVGTVQRVVKIEGEEEMHISASIPIEPFPVTSSTIAIQGEEIYLENDKVASNFLDRFENSSYTQYMIIEKKMSGSMKVDGI